MRRSCGAAMGAHDRLRRHRGPAARSGSARSAPGRTTSAHGDDPDDDARRRRSAAPSRSSSATGRWRAIGIGSFGPVDRDAGLRRGATSRRRRSRAGRTPTSASEIGRRLAVPVAFDTDVNAAALGEHRWGAARGLDTFCYVTVGTGIGGGAMVDGRLVHGLSHPEFGHLRIPHDLDADPFAGRLSLPRRLLGGPRVPARRSRRAGGGQPSSSATTPSGSWRRGTSRSASSR